MKIPEYVSKAEVRRVCRELGLRDWTKLTGPKVSRKEAAAIRKIVGKEALKISIDEFRQGLEVELEHGIQFGDTNVTNNHPVLTGRIVVAHLKETLDYYARLEVAELEGDIFKAALAGDAAKMLKKYKGLLKARYILSNGEKSRARVS